jgi:hypothetical protein
MSYEIAYEQKSAPFPRFNLEKYSSFANAISLSPPNLHHNNTTTIPHYHPNHHQLDYHTLLSNYLHYH